MEREVPGETDPQIHKSENDEGEGHAAPLGCAYARGRGLPPVGSGGCLGLGSAALPSPAADLSFVLGQELPESGGFGGPGPGLVICNKTQEGSGVGVMAQTPHKPGPGS